MNTVRDSDTVIGEWLDDGPQTLPAETRQAITVGIRTVTRRRSGIAWPFAVRGLRTFEPRQLPVALAGAAVVVVAAAVALSFYANQQGLGRTPPANDAMWPQSTLEEVQQAQAAADAGDRSYAWQVDPELREWYLYPSLADSLGDAEIVARFLRDELGWEEFRFNPISEDGFGDGVHTNAAYIRCAPGRTNSLYPESGCAPTIDEVRYERVSIDLEQLVRKDPTGIWVVTGWRTLPPFEQVVPPSDAEATELLGAFVQARIDGAGAEQYVDVVAEPPAKSEVPLLYTTTTGAIYDRSDFEIVNGPVWPDGSMRVKVQLFARDDTAVEQTFFIVRNEGRLRLEYRSGALDVAPTTENGQPVPTEYSFLDGEVTFRAIWPWEPLPDQTPTTLGLDTNGQGIQVELGLLADPLPVEAGCAEGPPPPDAAALAQMIESDPDLQATAPVAANVGGMPALRMDIVTAASASACDATGAPQVVSGHAGLLGSQRMRLYVLDLPGDSARILAIAFTAEAADFDRAMEAAVPIVDSFELHTP